MHTAHPMYHDNLYGSPLFIPLVFRFNFSEQKFIVQVDVYVGEQIGFNGVLRYYLF